MHSIFISLMAVLVVVVAPAATENEQASAHLRLVRDKDSGEAHLLVTVNAPQEKDLKIRAASLFDTAVNIDVTRRSDGKALSNYAGGSDPRLNTQFLVVPRGLELTIRAPFPRSEAFMKDSRVPGEYMLKLRYFKGSPLLIRILDNGELAPIEPDDK